MSIPRFLPAIAVAFLIATPPGIFAAEAPKPPAEYNEALRLALRSFTERDFPKAIAALDRAEAILPPTPMTLNTRGAVLLDEKKFVEGEKFCRRALELDPTFYPARFNLCEIPLMQKRPAEAREMFQKMLEEYPSDELIRYRILLTWLLDKNEVEARRALESLPFPGYTPAYYYGHAAWHFSRGEDEEAQKWMVRGNWVFTADITINFSESLKDIGWIKVAPPTGGKLPE